MRRYRVAVIGSTGHHYIAGDAWNGLRDAYAHAIHDDYGQRGDRMTVVAVGPLRHAVSDAFDACERVGVPVVHRASLRLDRAHRFDRVLTYGTLTNAERAWVAHAEADAADVWRRIDAAWLWDYAA